MQHAMLNNSVLVGLYQINITRVKMTVLCNGQTSNSSIDGCGLMYKDYFIYLFIFHSSFNEIKKLSNSIKLII